MYQAYKLPIHSDSFSIHTNDITQSKILSYSTKRQKQYKEVVNGYKYHNCEVVAIVTETKIKYFKGGPELEKFIVQCEVDKVESPVLVILKLTN